MAFEIFAILAINPAMSVQTLFFDAADTLIALAEPVSDVYARIGKTYGLSLSSRGISTHLSTAFQSTPAPDYQSFEDGEQAEFAWWRDMVANTLTRAGASDFSSSEDYPAYFQELFDHYAQVEAWTLYPDTVPALERAKSSGYQLAVISNFDQRLRPILDAFQLTTFFDLILSSADAKSRKPNPEIFFQAINQLGIDAKNCAHVGDSFSKDIAGAQAAGISAFHLVRPQKTLHDFLDFASISRS